MNLTRSSFPKCLAAFLAAALLFLSPVADACTTLCVRHGGRIVFGKNYDWNIGDGLLIVNKRGVEKVSASAVPARWTSRFGSVTFNQYGRENPMGGMNEAGLVVELMWAEGSRYPRADARPAVDCLTWIQYQLDTAATVGEVIASDAKIRIDPDSVPLHFLVTDRTGNVATIEFIGGKLVAHTGDSLPVAALANDLYGGSLNYLNKLDDAGQPVTLNYTSLNRFSHAARRAREYDAGKHGDPVPYVFETLAQVAQRQHTQWSIVYEIDRGHIHFRTQQDPQSKSLAIASLDFSCGSPVLLMDLHRNEPGDARQQLQPYTRQVNLALMRSSYAKTEFLARTPSAEIERRANLPESTVCRQATAALAPK